MGALAVLMHDSSERDNCIADSNTPKSEGRLNAEAPLSEISNDPPKQTNALTSFQDQTDPIVSGVKPKRDPIPDPYPPQDMNKVLGRLMTIDSFDWQSTDTQGSVIASVDLPGALLQLESVWERAGRFRYLRSDLEIQVRLNSTSFHYGSLLVYIIPDTTNAEEAALVTDMWEASMLEPKIILARSETPLTFVVPFQHQEDFYDLNNAQTDPAGMLRMGIVVLTPLRSASAAANTKLSISVWARFVNPVVAGPKSRIGTIPTLPKFKRSHLSERPKRLAPLKKKAEKKKKAFAAQVTPQSEAETKTTMQTTGNVGQRMSAFASKFSQIPIVGEVAKPIQWIGDLLGDLGMDKPDNLRPVEKVFIEPFMTGFSGKGLAPSVSMSLNPEAKVSDDELIFGRSSPITRSFRAMAMTPSLWGCWDILYTSEANTIITDIPVEPTPRFVPNARYWTWCSAAASHFLLWRGSMKFMFVFTTSQFTTARVRLTYHPEAASVNVEENNGGDVISQIVDIKGDTICKVTVPYLNSSPYLRVPYTDAEQITYPNGILSMTLVNEVVTQDNTIEDVGIQVSVWVSCGEDIDFALPYTSRPPDTEVQAQGDICQAFECSFAPIVKATAHVRKQYVTSESELSINTYLHRYMSAFGTNSTVTSPADPYDKSWAVKPFIWNLFRFRRGSMRYRTVYLGSTTTTPFTMGYTSSTNGVVDTSTPSAIQVQFLALWDGRVYYTTLPYFCTHKYVKLNPTTARNVVVATPYWADPGTSSYYVDAAVGDDFMFGGIAPAPTITWE